MIFLNALKENIEEKAFSERELRGCKSFYWLSS